MLPVLGTTTDVIPERPVRQQQSQEENVEVRRRFLEQRWTRPEEGTSDLGQIVEVASDTPPPAAEQQRRALLSTGVDVLRRNVLSFLPPHHDLPLRLWGANGYASKFYERNIGRRKKQFHLYSVSRREARIHSLFSI